MAALAAMLFVLVGCTAANPATAEAFDETITLDMRVHVLHSPESAALTATLDDAEVARLIEQVNATWRQAGIEWRLESIVRAEALNVEPFERVLSGRAPPRFAALTGVMPRDNLAASGWNVFLIGNLFAGVGGIYFPEIPAVLQPEVDPQGVRGLAGGLPRILAHELGHALGLPHVPCPAAGNLMAPACVNGDRTRLTSQQIRVARMQAALGAPFRGRNPAGIGYFEAGFRRLDGIDMAAVGEALPARLVRAPEGRGPGHGTPHRRRSAMRAAILLILALASAFPRSLTGQQVVTAEPHCWGDLRGTRLTTSFELPGGRIFEALWTVLANDSVQLEDGTPGHELSTRLDEIASIDPKTGDREVRPLHREVTTKYTGQSEAQLLRRASSVWCSAVTQLEAEAEA